MRDAQGVSYEKAIFWDAYYSVQLGIDPAPQDVTAEDEAALAAEIEATK